MFWGGIACVVASAMPICRADDPPTSTAPPAETGKQAEGARVLVVEMQGTRAVAKDTCLARVQLRAGMTYEDHIVSEDIRRLYSLGYFTDVQVKTDALADGVKVIFVVAEKAAIHAIEVEGATHLAVKKIRELLKVKPGELFDPRKLKDGVEQVKNQYHRQGYFQAEVGTTATTEQAANTTTIYVVVDEGPRMRVAQILIEGNLAFSEGKIRRLLKTKPRWLFASGAFNEQTLEEDLERLRAFYRKQGYQDVAVTNEVRVGPSGDALYVHLRIAEGLQHRVGQVTVLGTVLFPEHELRRLLRLKPGAVYSTDALQEDVRAIKQYYGDRGYINAQVEPETTLDQTTKRVGLAFRMTERELAYVQRIEVRGNLHTKDVVVRRELRIHPGEPFNGQKIRRSLERLYNLGIFEEVSVDTQPLAQPNHADLIVDVKEAKTGSFSFGGGFSSVDRLLGMVELEQRNFDWRNYPTFTGAGEDLRFRVEIGSVRRYFDLSFTEPWVFGYPWSLGLDAFNRTRLRSESLGLAYEEERRGAGIRLAKELTEALRLDVGYQLSRVVISNITDDASTDLKAEAGRNYVSVAGTTLTWDTRDNRFDPTRGVLIFSSADLAGGVLGGDKDFYRVQGGASSFLPHAGRFVFESRLRGGIVNNYSKTTSVPIFERFFAGGANIIRGFRENRVGPRDPASDDPIGGEAVFVGSVEEVMTVVKDEHGKPILKSSVFFDVGNVWRRVGDFGGSLKSGTGVGLRVNTPIGPLRLDVGFPVSQLNGEKRRPRLHFNISRSF